MFSVAQETEARGPSAQPVYSSGNRETVGILIHQPSIACLLEAGANASPGPATATAYRCRQLLSSVTGGPRRPRGKRLAQGQLGVSGDSKIRIQFKEQSTGWRGPPRRHRPGATPLLPPQAPCHPQIPSESVAPLWPLPSLTPSVAPHTITGKGTQEPGRPAVHPRGIFQDPTPGAAHVPHSSQPERRPAGPRGPEGPELFSPGAGSSWTQTNTSQHPSQRLDTCAPPLGACGAAAGQARSPQPLEALGSAGLGWARGWDCRFVLWLP